MYDFGPSWQWAVFALLALIGALACLAGIVCGIVWLCNHVQFV